MAGGNKVIQQLSPYHSFEDISLLETGKTIVSGEVMPHANDAWYVPDSVKTG